jgi:NAD(P)-dependent dehydrogenase (short-subunit alcohol dehydrogenase family)
MPAMTSLTGKTALVTGASKGIGRAIALAFGEAGANVVATARTASEIEDVASSVRGFGSKALAVVADMGVQADVENMARTAENEFDGVDILVNNAAIIHRSIPVVDMNPELWREVLDVNLTGAFLLTRAVLPGMIDRGYGKVINISSIGVTCPR